MWQRIAGDKSSPMIANMETGELTAAAAVPPPLDVDFERRINLKIRLHEKLLDILNLSVIDEMTREELSRELAPIVRDLVARQGTVLNSMEFSNLLKELLDEVLGLGPLEPLLQDPTVSDILVNTHQKVFVERGGQLEPTTVRFKDERHLLRIIQRIVAAVGRRVDESQPWVDARLADGSRVNALVAPCAVDGALLSIRKFSRRPFTAETLVENGSMSREIATVLQAIVRMRLNVLVSGGTGSGKTTLLNVLSRFIGERERVLTIEDTAELQMQQEHVGRMETRPENIEGMGAVTQRDLLKNALRMRPDRIIVGEVRGAEVLDMLQAMNTGHDGSMTTVHANTPRDAVTRLEHMIGMSGLDLPTRVLRAQIASAIHIVMQVQRFSDGKRRFSSLQEIVGMEGDVVLMQEIFRFQREGVDAEGRVLGKYCATGIRPKFAERAKEWGFALPGSLFNTN